MAGVEARCRPFHINGEHVFTLTFESIVAILGLGYNAR
jgi:hypothetical protein